MGAKAAMMANACQRFLNEKSASDGDTGGGGGKQHHQIYIVNSVEMNKTNENLNGLAMALTVCSRRTCSRADDVYRVCIDD